MPRAGTTTTPATAQEQLLAVADVCKLAGGALAAQARLLTELDIASDMMDHERVGKVREKLHVAVARAHAAQRTALEALNQILP